MRQCQRSDKSPQVHSSIRIYFMENGCKNKRETDFIVVEVAQFRFIEVEGLFRLNTIYGIKLLYLQIIIFSRCSISIYTIKSFTITLYCIKKIEIQWYRFQLYLLLILWMTVFCISDGNASYSLVEKYFPLCFHGIFSATIC